MITEHVVRFSKLRIHLVKPGMVDAIHVSLSQFYSRTHNSYLFPIFKMGNIAKRTYALLTSLDTWIFIPASKVDRKDLTLAIWQCIVLFGISKYGSPLAWEPIHSWQWRGQRHGRAAVRTGQRRSVNLLRESGAKVSKHLVVETPS